MEQEQLIEVKRERAYAVLTLNRPQKMNALNDALLLQMQAALDELERDETVRALIVTGAGKAFSAGFDISKDQNPFKSVQDWRAHVQIGKETWLRIWRSRMPVIAAVNGYCFGGGCDLSMVCDLTIAADDAEFGEPEIQFQSSPPFMIMPWVLGMKQTKELLLTGDRVDAAGALRMGLVNKVVPAAELMTHARSLALKLAKMPPPGMTLNKQGINRGYEIRGFQSTVDYGSEIFTLALLSESDEANEFFAVAAQRGLKEAFKWRDQRFADPA